MRNFYLLIFAAVFLAAPLRGQTPANTSDPRTLQALIEEVRSLRRDLQTTSATVQRMQILLYRVRNQMEVVSQARQRHDQAQAMLAQSRNQREYALNQIKEQQAMLENTQDSERRKELEQAMEATKQWIARADQFESDAQMKESDSANDFRLEQGKLNELQEQLDRLDRKLDTQIVARQ
jgi:hypothetical protein